MRRLNFNLHALCISAAAAMLAGCSASQPPIAMPQSRTLGPARTFTHGTTGPSYRVVYRFHHSRGTHPQAGLIDVNGTLYGTTVFGGTYGKGTVYSISASGTETVLHSFSGRGDGARPQAGLIDVNGTLYGTTAYGGSSSDFGTVYSISTSGSEKVLHSFTGTPDGEQPDSGLIDVNGTLYGTTAYGGACNGCGTVFRISTSGQEKIVYAFTGDASGGAVPDGGLIAVKGALYGTTAYGGGSGCGAGCGVVFSTSTRGKEKVLYRFTGGSDGEQPHGTLINVNGTLYGTTGLGGGYGCTLNLGCGTVYSIGTTGAETVLYRFAGGSDGANPIGGLIDMNGTLYGTTYHGAGSGCDRNAGCGTIYSLSTAGVETVLYRFTRVSDGADPAAPLLNVSGTLYGTTTSGGLGCRKVNHCGTVFALSP